MKSSNALLICRIDWQPSRLLSGLYAVLGMLVAYALWLSALPRLMVAVCGLAGVLWAVVQAFRNLGQSHCHITWPGAGEPALIKTAAGSYRIDAVCLHLRGPLAVLSGNDSDGKTRRWVWYPDTLDAPDRRALRLAASLPTHSPSILPIAAA